MPKIFQPSHSLMQLQNEVQHLEMTLIERIRSKQDMTSTSLKHTEPTNKQLQQTPVAIVGMASLFPQSRNLQEYWQKIVSKEDCITDVPPSRWNVDDYYDPDPTTPDKTYCKRGGFIPEIDFNPMEFGIPPNQLEVTDISQLLALVVAKEALKDAGYGDKPFDNEQTGVVLGVALARQLTKPFDIDSDGMMLGEGVGMLVLKRLADAERDKDRIYAVIKGVGTSSDGRHKSIYAPRPEGQMRALRRAYESAGFEPNTVGAIEAHGTGTMAGDPAEFAALKGVFGENKDRKQIALGSVKSQIGHTWVEN